MTWALAVGLAVSAVGATASAHYRHRNVQAVIEAWKLDWTMDLVGALKAVCPRAVRLPKRGEPSAP